MPVVIKPLEYSKETLGKRLKSVRFINIQGARDVSIDLPPSGVIRLHASSEVGKSSLLRPFEALVTSKYSTKREIQSLVTKGCDTGELICELYNGTFVALHLDVTNMNKCCYGVQYPGKPLEQLPYPQSLPKILEILGWYTTGLTDKLDFSLNVRLKGVLPLIDTPKRLNTEILKIALNDSELDRTYEAVNKSLEDVNADLARVCTTLDGAKFTLDQLKLEDTESLKYELEALERLQAELSWLTQLENAITELYVTSTHKPTLQVAPREVLPLIEQLETYNRILGELELIVNTPKPQLYHAPKDVEELINNLKVLSDMEHSINDIIKLPKPDKVTVPRELEDKIKLHGNLTELEKNLSEIVQLRKPEVVKFNKADIESYISLYENLCSMETCLKDITTLLDRKPDYDRQLLVLEKLHLNLDFIETGIYKLRELDSNIKSIQAEKSKYQCPTCGQYFTDKYNHSSHDLAE